MQGIRPNALKSFLPIKYDQWRQKYVRSCKSKDGEGMLYVDYNADNKLLPAEAVTVSEAIGCVLCTWCIYGVCWALLVTLCVRDPAFHGLHMVFTHSQPLMCMVSPGMGC